MMPKLALHGARAKVATAVAATVVVGGGATALEVTSSSSTPAIPPTHYHLVTKADGCRPGNPKANVYHPYRLQVRERCMTVVGTVAYTRVEDDGDVHVDLKLPPGERHLLNRYNDSQQYGQLVTEIVPADRPGCKPGTPPKPAQGGYNYGICTGADIHVPPVGALVKETGPYVLDSDHGWMEIHPVWRLVVLRGPLASTTTSSSSSSTTTTATRPPTVAPPVTEAPATTAPPSTAPATTEPPTTAPTTTVAAAWCKAYSVSANDGFPGDFDIHVASDEPYTSATARSATDTYGYETNASGSAVIYLWYQQPGEAVTVTVGPATCHTTDP